jgi:hypothetical protein
MEQPFSLILCELDGFSESFLKALQKQRSPRVPVLVCGASGVAQYWRRRGDDASGATQYVEDFRGLISALSLSLSSVFEGAV